MRMRAVILAIVVLLASIGCGREPAGIAVALPGGAGGLGFDDLRYSPTLHRVLVPGGRSGRLFLIEPGSLAVTYVSGFGAVDAYAGDHGEGPTSVDEGVGKIFVTDRTRQRLFVVDPVKLTIVGEAPLAGSPDYVRFVASRNELWVTEPSIASMEVFTLGTDGVPVHDATFAVANGPESLVIDATRGRAYAHRWQASTVAIDLKTRAIVAEWPNGCATSRGIALDEARGFLFSGCSEGTAAVLDVAHDGRILSTMAKGAGFDVIAYAPTLGHLYLAGKTCACLVTLGVSHGGALSFVDRVDAPTSTHCVTADDVGHAWVCDPDQGQLWRVDDDRPSALR